MMHIHETVFKDMRKRAVAYIMQENSHLGGFEFFLTDRMTFLLQMEQGFSHQMVCTKRMIKSRVYSTWIHIMCKTKLFDPSEALEIRMFDQAHQILVVHRNKTVNRVVEYFIPCQRNVPL